MLVKPVLLVLLFGVVSSQVEQSIFAQQYPRYYPPVALDEPKKVASQSAVEAVEATATGGSVERLAVLPLLARARRSGFTSETDREGNDAALARVRHLLADPGWYPEIVQRVQRHYDD